MSSPCAAVRVLKLRLAVVSADKARIERENVELRRQLAERNQGPEAPQ